MEKAPLLSRSKLWFVVIVFSFICKMHVFAGSWVWHLLSKYWIIVCAILFLVMAVQDAVIYRIVYMVLFLYFIISFKVIIMFRSPMQ